MEKWKIGVIIALLAGLVGYGLLQQQENKPAATPEAATAQATPAPSPFLGRTIGEGLPEWSNVKQWVNTPKPISLASLKGKVALVEAFRTGCSHCEEAVPFMEMLYERYKPRGLQLVALQSPGAYDDATNPENDWQKVQQWLKQRKVAYPVGFDEKSDWFQQKLKGERYPTVLILDTTGKVGFAQTGFDTTKAVNMSVEIEKLLPGPGTPQERAQDVVKWMAPYLRIETDKSLVQALTDDVAQRLQGQP